MTTSMLRAILAFLLCSPILPGTQDPPDTQKPEEKQTAGPDTTAHGKERRTRVRLGGVVVGAGYSHFSGPYYSRYPYYGWPYGPYYLPFYGWAWYDPFFHSGFYNGFAREADKGEVRLRTDEPKAEVYLDGAYAGRAEERKSMWLDPGAYNLEVRADNRAPFSRRIYVLTGKVLKIEASLGPQGQETKP